MVDDRTNRTQPLKGSSFFRWCAFSAGSCAGVWFLTVFCAEILGMPERFAVAPPLVILFVWNFITMRYFVFGKQTDRMELQLIKYTATSLSFRGIEFLTYYLLVSRWEFQYSYVILVVMPLTFVAKYVVYGLFVFRSNANRTDHTGRLSQNDIAVLAELHLDCLPLSLVSRLGLSYARSFYRFMERSTHEVVLVRRDEDRIVAACVLTLKPTSLNRRLLSGSALITAFLRSGKLLNWLPVLTSRSSRKRGFDGTIAHSGPEIILLYTSEHCRGMGHGVSLLREAESRIAAAGFSRYFLKTVDMPDNPAFRFYERNGLTMGNCIMTQGRTFRVWHGTTTGYSSPPRTGH